MQIRNYLTCIVIFLFHGIATANDSCNYASLHGKEFQFKEIREPMQKYGYSRWTNETRSISKRLNYADYVGKKGKKEK
jgi:hypothetical protein